MSAAPNQKRGKDRKHASKRPVAGGSGEDRRTRGGDGAFRYHGNYGGPGWTGGRFTRGEDVDDDYRIPPVDGTDAVFRWHDYHYRPGFSRAAADRVAALEVWNHPGPKSKVAALALGAKALYREYTGDFWDRVGQGGDLVARGYGATTRSMERALVRSALNERIHARQSSAVGSEHPAQTMSKSSTKMNNDRAIIRRPDLRFTCNLPGHYDSNAATGAAINGVVHMQLTTTTNPAYQVNPSGDNPCTTVGPYGAYGFGISLPKQGWYEATFIFRLQAQSSTGTASNYDTVSYTAGLSIVQDAAGTPVSATVAFAYATAMMSGGGGFFNEKNLVVHGAFWWPGPLSGAKINMINITLSWNVNTSGITSINYTYYLDQWMFKRLSDEYE